MKEFAPGIPAGKPINKIRPTRQEVWRMVLQEHPAARAGLHTDIRIGDPSTGEAHSWVTRKGMPTPGGPPIAIYRQPTHTYKYMDFEGPINRGYGRTKKGKSVKKLLDEVVEILESNDDKIRFNVYAPRNVEEFIFSKSRDDRESWRAMNITHTKEKLEKKFDFGKPAYKSTDIGAIDLSDDDQFMSAKLDGGHNIFWLKEGNKPRVFSHRLSGSSKSGVIEQSHKLPYLYNQTVPKGLGETIVRGEIYATDPESGSPVPAETVAGMLNAGVIKSRQMQNEYGKLKPAIFDVVKFKGMDVKDAPYEKKLQMLDEISKAMDGIEVPAIAKTRDEKEKLLESIRSKEYSETHEGVVLWPKGVGVPTKSKFSDTFRVYLVGMEEAIDKNGDPKGEMGAIWYSMTPNGNPVGKVGTGFTSDERKEMWSNQDDYLNKFAYIKAQVQYKSGALGKPSFSGMEKNSSMPTFEYIKEKKTGIVRAVSTSKNKSMTEEFKNPDIQKYAEAYMPKSSGFRKHFARYAVPGMGKATGVEYRIGKGMKNLAVGGDRIVKISSNPSESTDAQKAVGVALAVIGAALLKRGGNPITSAKAVKEFLKSIGEAASKSPEALKAFGRIGLTGIGAVAAIKGIDRF